MNGESSKIVQMCIRDRHKGDVQTIESTEGLELLILIAEETGINLTEIWKLVSRWNAA